MEDKLIQRRFCGKEDFVVFAKGHFFMFLIATHCIRASRFKKKTRLRNHSLLSSALKIDAVRKNVVVCCENPGISHKVLK